MQDDHEECVNCGAYVNKDDGETHCDICSDGPFCRLCICEECN